MYDNRFKQRDILVSLTGSPSLNKVFELNWPAGILSPNLNQVLIEKWNEITIVFRSTSVFLNADYVQTMCCNLLFDIIASKRWIYKYYNSCYCCLMEIVFVIAFKCNNWSQNEVKLCELYIFRYFEGEHRTPSTSAAPNTHSL